MQRYYLPMIFPERKTHCTKNHPKERFPKKKKKKKKKKNNNKESNKLLEKSKGTLNSPP